MISLTDEIKSPVLLAFLFIFFGERVILHDDNSTIPHNQSGMAMEVCIHIVGEV